MITVLDISLDKRQGFFVRAAGALRKADIRVQVKSCGRLKVMYITCHTGFGRVDWGKIADYAGGARGYVLCDKELLLPRRLGFRRFYSQSLSRLMAINGTITVLSLLKTQCRRLSLCFCDPGGEYARYAPLFLPLCGKMTVLTKSGAYSDFPDYAMGEYGACVRVCRDERELSDCRVIVAPRFSPLENYRGERCVMFTAGGESRNPLIKTVGGYSWGLPPKYRPLKPYFLSDEYFSQALYSVAHCADAAKASPYEFDMCGQRLTASDIAAVIASQAFPTLDTADSKAYNKL